MIRPLRRDGAFAKIRENPLAREPGQYTIHEAGVMTRARRPRHESRGHDLSHHPL